MRLEKTMWKRTVIITITLLAAALIAGVCDPGGDEPATISLPVVVDGDEIVTCVNDEGWTVEVLTFRLAVRDLEFTIEGETHAGLSGTISELLIPTAWAHPGHLAGGEVTGELIGDFVLDLRADVEQSLGRADLLVGEYQGFNLSFRASQESDGLDGDDPLLGHTAVIEGQATRGVDTVDFTAVLNVEDGVEMVGGVFDLNMNENTSSTLAVRLHTIDPYENDTLFDGLEFLKIDDDHDGVALIEPGDEAHNVLAKTLVRHDHYSVIPKP